MPQTPAPSSPNVPLDLAALRQALASLQRGLTRWQAASQDEELRDACIQRFEYCFELCWKMLKRRLEMDLPDGAAVDAMSYRELVRVGAERGLLNEPSAWWVYRDKRNITSHTYNADKARDVAGIIPAFAAHAQQLLAQLEAQGLRNA